MPFQSQDLSSNLVQELDCFLKINNFPDLFRKYEWENDTHDKQFPDIYNLEVRLSKSDMEGGITLDNVRGVAEWGGLPNLGRIRGNNIVAPQNTFNVSSGGPIPNLASRPGIPIAIISEVEGIGPTYQSKVLRFALAQEYGAIDTRCVRVFGQGSPATQKHEWLDLVATQGAPNRWSIPEVQQNWPAGYSVWINILRYLANNLPKNCPHTSNFVNGGLRKTGEWSCADVEMALFTYASEAIAAI